MLIENGIGPRAASPELRRSRERRAGADRKVVLFAGRFDRQKAFDTFVGTMRQLGDAARGLAIGRAIVSSGLLEELPPGIELLGRRPRADVIALFAQADLLLMPLRSEGIPMVALEAMQAGLPVFATRVGGLPEMIVDGDTGALFEAEDAGSIVACIRACDIDTLREYGAAGRRRFGRLYTADRMNERLWRLHAGLVAPGPAPGIGPRAGSRGWPSGYSPTGRSPRDPVAGRRTAFLPP